MMEVEKVEMGEPESIYQESWYLSDTSNLLNTKFVLDFKFFIKNWTKQTKSLISKNKIILDKEQVCVVNSYNKNQLSKC